ncbi:MAG: hypothetical protein JW820_02840 [Spirochaetales bacterium]|nr:hypothetical protein [Spirochaetales bacterium]
MEGDTVQGSGAGERIRRERLEKRQRSLESIAEGVLRGDAVSACGHLLFHTPAQGFASALGRLLELLGRGRDGDTESARSNILLFLCRLRVDLGSFVPAWALADALGEAAIEKAAAEVEGQLGGLAEAWPDAEAAALARIHAEERSRFKAEGLEDEGATQEATRLAGGSLKRYAAALLREIQASNLLDAARARRAGTAATEIGNDYALFLPYVIRLGGSFVTTNPVLIKVAWDTDRELWDRRIDQLILTRFSPQELGELVGARRREDVRAAVDSLSSLVTMKVVEENCRLLRDIFLVTDGREGYVSLQVNPKNHDDAAGMVGEARSLYGFLEERLGGVPNVVFKLPGTAAGLQAAQELTGGGIGVTITVSFSVHQAVAFGRVLSRGRALVSYIALMNGRMAFPVRDELAENAVPGGPEAARWAGVEVARKAYRRLYGAAPGEGEGIDPGKVKLLIASLRIYGDWIPDLSEQWGCPVITCFPNVRRAYDSRKRPLDPGSISGRTPPEALETLGRSEIFRQAWWTPQDGERLRPAQPLSLAPGDAAALSAWAPMRNTLNQFVELYDQMGEMVLARMKVLAAGS